MAPSGDSVNKLYKKIITYLDYVLKKIIIIYRDVSRLANFSSTPTQLTPKLHRSPVPVMIACRRHRDWRCL